MEANPYPQFSMKHSGLKPTRTPRPLRELFYGHRRASYWIPTRLHRVVQCKWEFHPLDFRNFKLEDRCPSPTSCPVNHWPRPPAILWSAFPCLPTNRLFPRRPEMCYLSSQEDPLLQLPLLHFLLNKELPPEPLLLSSRLLNYLRHRQYCHVHRLPLLNNQWLFLSLRPPDCQDCRHHPSRSKFPFDLSIYFSMPAGIESIIIRPPTNITWQWLVESPGTARRRGLYGSLGLRKVGAGHPHSYPK
jgi:hypothetical protein